MENLLVAFARTTGMLIEAAAVVVVAYGAVEAFVKFGRIVINPGATHGERKALWRGLGMWLLLGLELELAADIIGSVVSPTWYEIGRLGAIAVIRTFLNYFLEKDLEHAAVAATGPATSGEARPLRRPRDGHAWIARSHTPERALLPQGQPCAVTAGPAMCRCRTRGRQEWRLA